MHWPPAWERLSDCKHAHLVSLPATRTTRTRRQRMPRCCMVLLVWRMVQATRTRVDRQRHKCTVCILAWCVCVRVCVCVCVSVCACVRVVLICSVEDSLYPPELSRPHLYDLTFTLELESPSPPSKHAWTSRGRHTKHDIASDVPPYTRQR